MFIAAAGKMISMEYLVIFACVLKYTSGFTATDCESKGNAYNKLEMAEQLIKSAKEKLPNDTELCLPLDCEDLLKSGEKISGVYLVWPKNRILAGPISVYCDMDTDGGGWTHPMDVPMLSKTFDTLREHIRMSLLTSFLRLILWAINTQSKAVFLDKVIQRRGNFGRSKDYFYQDWQAYKEGFGNLEEDFWLGNDKIYVLSNQKLYSARFDLGDVEGNKRYAVYDTFWIDNEENNYTLHNKGYKGDAGDSLAGHNGGKFSTKDRDNDVSNSNCAQVYKGAWWFIKCHLSNLNGEYRPGKIEDRAQGLIWYHWKGHNESLATTEIKIRKNPSWVK